MDSKDIKYLAFEGGGGKGGTYLGAIAALTDLNLLPIVIQNNKMQIDQEKKEIIPDTTNSKFNDYNPPSKIKGISGSSAGAITGLCLAMGMDMNSLANVLKTKTFYWGTPMSIFSSFFDFNNESYVLSNQGKLNINSDYVVRTITNNKGAELETLFRSKEKSAINGVGQVVLGWLKGLLKTYAKIVYGTEKHSIVDAMYGFSSTRGGFFSSNDQKFDLHLKGLIHGGGLFPGLNARKFIQELIQKNLLDKPEIRTKVEKYNEEIWIKDSKSKRQPQPFEKHRFYNRIELLDKNAARNLTFEQFYYLTGINLILTGTNITNGIPVYFSKDRTPDFPVSEAVAISMNLPLLFTPIWNKAKVFQNTENFYKKLANYTNRKSYDFTKYNNMYRGLYIDGGVTNNLPIHAFDDINAPFSNFLDPRFPKRNLSINKNVLGLRLTEGEPKHLTSKDGEVNKDEDFSLSSYGGSSLYTALYHSEQGRILDRSEYNQCVDLYTYELSTTNFAPTGKQLKPPIEGAYKTTMKKFNKSAEVPSNLSQLLETWDR